ncbi:hypothetical protein [Risungbinella massiliensis]|uniref:hypothetical protein n=1 Tax=Risungbinella massiliensis TaxID=1329796 RepID=UPI0005CC2169|nr:hypothetical protein [Risungbinella massiliensis]
MFVKMARKKLVLNLTNHKVPNEMINTDMQVVRLDQLEISFENVNQLYQIIKEGVLDSLGEEEFESYEDFVACIFPIYLRNASTTFLAQRGKYSRDGISK